MTDQQQELQPDPTCSTEGCVNQPAMGQWCRACQYQRQVSTTPAETTTETTECRTCGTCHECQAFGAGVGVARVVAIIEASTCECERDRAGVMEWRCVRCHLLAAIKENTDA